MLQAAAFLLVGMRRVVGGYHIYRAVLNTRKQCHLVVHTSQRRVHLPAPVLAHAPFIQKQIVRSGLAGYFHPARFRLANKLHALFGRDMADMQTTPCLLAQSDIAFHFAPLALGADTAMSVRTRIHACVYIPIV